MTSPAPSLVTTFVVATTFRSAIAPATLSVAVAAPLGTDWVPSAATVVGPFRKTGPAQTAEPLTARRAPGLAAVSSRFSVNRPRPYVPTDRVSRAWFRTSCLPWTLGNPAPKRPQLVPPLVEE